MLLVVSASELFNKLSHQQAIDTLHSKIEMLGQSCVAPVSLVFNKITDKSQIAFLQKLGSQIEQAFPGLIT